MKEALTITADAKQMASDGG